jgi:hypothetical protein
VDRKAAFAGKCLSGGRLNIRKAIDQPRITIAGEAEAVARVEGVPTHSYVIESSTNLLNWSAVATNRLLTSEWFYTNSVSTGQQFFRAAPAH